MNNIINAGEIKCGTARKNKQFEIIYCGCNGKLISDCNEIPFSSCDTLVIPPLTEYSLPEYCYNCILIELEQAILPFKKICVIKDDSNGGIRFAAEQAVEYIKSQHVNRKIILSALGGLIAGYLTAFSENVPLSPAVEIIKAEIENNLSNTAYSLEDSLKKLPLNYDYMRKLFKKEIGVTPHEYLTSRRMELAKGLLESGISNRYSSYSVSQISEACGFSEPLYFSRVFKKYFGCSPANFIK